MNISPQQFQALILNWFERYGRKLLPWQQNKTVYRVWVSEIMLQQTQVNTVIPYFERFMLQFPNLLALANASEDEVLHLWAGLGYYSRARNLHKTAQIIRDNFNGCFPNSYQHLQSLPGIGRSTAGAILSIAFNQPAAILDGNVKRVLARFHGILKPIQEKATENELWKLAENYISLQHPAKHSQAMMDLGATVCVRNNPNCNLCPLSEYCIAHVQGITSNLPVKKVSRELPQRSATFLLLHYKNQFLLKKRPPIGIWGGLWSFPELPEKSNIKTIRTYCRQRFHIQISEYQMLDSLQHTFSHYHLTIFPVFIPVKRLPSLIMDDTQQIWYNPSEPELIGLPKPVQLILQRLR